MFNCKHTNTEKYLKGHWSNKKTQSQSLPCLERRIIIFPHTQFCQSNIFLLESSSFLPSLCQFTRTDPTVMNRHSERLVYCWCSFFITASIFTDHNQSSPDDTSLDILIDMMSLQLHKEGTVSTLYWLV